MDNSGPPQSGFTLVELIVVISIIALLSTIGFAVYRSSQISARDGKRVQDIKEIQKALEQYYAVNNGYIPVGAASGSTTVNTLTALNSYFQNNTPPTDPNLTEVSSYEYTYYTCNGNATAVPPVPADQYLVCARLVSPSGKANTNPAPASSNYGCGSIEVSSGTATYYCAKSLSR